MKKKTENQLVEQSPLQAEKEKVLQEKLTEPEPEPKKPPVRRKRKKAEPEIDPKKVEQEGRATLELIVWVRNVLGVGKPLPPHAVNLYLSSYGAIVQKYGDVFSRWMPEIMFGGSLLMIGYDTHLELKKLKAEQAKKQAVGGPEKAENKSSYEKPAMV